MKISNYANRVELSLARKLFNEAKNYTNVVDLTLGDPDFDTPNHIKKAGIQAIKDGYSHYSANAGLINARNAIAKNIKKNWGINANANEEIITTVGGMEALFLSLTCLVNPNDEVIIFEPYYVNYVQMVQLLGGKPVILNAYKEEIGFSIDEEELKKNINDKTVAIIINSPSNPSGDIVSKENLIKIAKVAEEFDLAVVSDEVYHSLVFDNKKHESILFYTNKPENVILIDSCSKEFCMTGWRIGYAYGNKEIIQNMIKLQENVAACASVVSQMALIEAYDNYENTNDYLEEYQKRRDYVFDRISKINKFSCVKPKGTFYMLINIENTGYNSLDFSLELLKSKQVAVVPGITYGKHYDNYVRLALTKDLDVLKDALDKIEDFVK